MNSATVIQSRKYVRLLFIALCLLVLAVFVAPLQAQQRTALQELQGMNLPVAKGKISIYYAQGHEERAAEVRSLIEHMMEFYEARLGIKQDFTVAILTRELWTKQFPKIPYGLPFVKESIAFLPATSDGVVTAGTVAMQSGTSVATLSKIEQSGYDFESGAMKFTDLIGLHELGHVYTSAYGIKLPSLWFNEFLASHFAYAFLKEKHPQIADLFQAMATDVYADAVKAKHTTLDDFDRLYVGVGVDNYSWYQGKFLEKGAQIYSARNLSFLADVRKAFPSDGNQKITPEETLKRLEQISPGISEWSKTLK